MYRGYELGSSDLADEIAVKNLMELINNEELQKKLNIEQEELNMICKAVKTQLLDNANRILNDERIIKTMKLNIK